MTTFYPSELEDHLMIGLEVTPRGAARGVQPERGRTFVRGGGAADPLLVDAAQTVTETWQLARFDRFWEDELQFGTLPFWVRDQRFDGQPLMTEGGEIITTPGGAPIVLTAWWLLSFAGRRPSQPSRGNAVNGGSVWLIRFPQLEKLN